MSRISADAAAITRGTAVVVVSHEGRVTVKETHTDKESDPYLRRLKSEHFQVLTLSEFTNIIESVKVQVAKGNLTPVIRFLMANTRPLPPGVYSPTATLRKNSPRETSSSPSAKESLHREPTSPKRIYLISFRTVPHPLLPKGLLKG